MTGQARLVPAPLYGLRTWTVVGRPGHERLAGAFRAVPWPTEDWLEATCARPDGGAPHAAPGHECSCGVHGWHPRRASARRVLAGRQTVAGVVEAVGAVEVHEDGFRAQRARPHALAQGRRNPALVRRLAAVYGVEVIETAHPDALLAWCRERGLGLDETTVRELLGPAEIERLRRLRRARARTNAARLAAAAAMVGLLLALGQQFVGDPPESDTVYGRTGEVRVDR